MYAFGTVMQIIITRIIYLKEEEHVMKKKNYGQALFGLILLLFAIAITLKATGVMDSSVNIWRIIFKSALLVLGLFLLCKRDSRAAGAIIFLVAAGLLFEEFTDFEMKFLYIAAAAAAVVGVSIMGQALMSNSGSRMFSDSDNHFVIFGGKEIKPVLPDYKGSRLTAVFGGIELDLRSLNITEDIEINTFCMFGGIEISVPDNVNIQVKSSAIFGGVENGTRNPFLQGMPSITVYATAVFGGVEIHN